MKKQLDRSERAMYNQAKREAFEECKMRIQSMDSDADKLEIGQIIREEWEALDREIDRHWDEQEDYPNYAYEQGTADGMLQAL